eukprot:TRINITY_DN16346_c0_g1::TRINITY_DN16346_c0_g1_i1::g.29509::m.29509 TRINITY_DN16346_c0_g1::TRINITY_DN16346_c0_g1_i1::g.29509  ORF type:complete len:158 (+),score=-6.13,Ribosomal_L32p/PF01783.18/3.7e-05 TRINITY_DN16346_c0_g1_i1:109-582(+)
MSLSTYTRSLAQVATTCTPCSGAAMSLSSAFARLSVYSNRITAASPSSIPSHFETNGTNVKGAIDANLGEMKYYELCAGPAPIQRRTRHGKRVRWAAWKLKPMTNLTTCSVCGKTKKLHQYCSPNCYLPPGLRPSTLEKSYEKNRMTQTTNTPQPQQ